MLEQLAIMARPVLDLPLIRRTRRNHGLEHATIHVLSAKTKNLRMAGRSTDSGFYLFGDAPTDQIEASAREALRRMQGGEHSLAIHPNCGTNLVTAGVLTSVAAMVGLGGSNRRDSFERLPVVMLLMMVAVLFAQPLGMSLQKHFTTDGDPADLEILNITRSTMTLPLSDGPMTVHTVATRSS